MHTLVKYVAKSNLDVLFFTNVSSKYKFFLCDGTYLKYEFQIKIHNY